MEAFVYAVYVVGFLAAFSALVVFAFASLPASIVGRGQNAGRFAGLGSAQTGPQSTPAAGSRVTSFDIPKARAA